MLPDIQKTFYFDKHFSPIFDPQVYDTPEKRFGYVLSIMRQARGMTRQEQLQRAIDPHSKRGNSTVSSWETGKAKPTIDELHEIFSALKLGQGDRDYLTGLLMGDLLSDDLLPSELQLARQEFEPYRSKEFPVYMYDHYWTIIDFNPAVQQFLGFDKRHTEDLIGKNLLEVIFHPMYKVLATIGDPDIWERIALEQIWGFRAELSNIRHHKKYISAIHDLAKGGVHQFLNLWYKTPEYYDAGQSIKISFTPAENTEITFEITFTPRTFEGIRKRVVVEWRHIKE